MHINAGCRPPKETDEEDVVVEEEELQQRSTGGEPFCECKHSDVGVSGRPQLTLCFLPAQPGGDGRGERTFISRCHREGASENEPSPPVE